jgi:hypothetical protein
MLLAITLDGILTLALIAGTVEWYNGKCEPKTYNAGECMDAGQPTTLLPQRRYGQRTPHSDVHHRQGCAPKNRPAGSALRRRPGSRLISHGRRGNHMLYTTGSARKFKTYV